MVVVRQTHFTTGVVGGGGGVGVEGEGLSKNTQYNQHNCEIRPRVLAHTKHTHTRTHKSIVRRTQTLCEKQQEPYQAGRQAGGQAQPKEMTEPACGRPAQIWYGRKAHPYIYKIYSCRRLWCQTKRIFAYIVRIERPCIYSKYPHVVLYLLLCIEECTNKSGREQTDHARHSWQSYSMQTIF